MSMLLIQLLFMYLRSLPFDFEDEEKLEAVSIQKPVESNLQKDDKAEEENLEVPDVRHNDRKDFVVNSSYSVFPVCFRIFLT